MPGQIPETITAEEAARLQRSADMHERIAGDYADKILTGAWKPGRVVKISDVMADWHVGRKMAGNALGLLHERGMLTETREDFYKVADSRSANDGR